MRPVQSHVSLKVEEGARKGEKEEDVTMEEWLDRCNFAGFEDGGREPWMKEFE